MRRGSGLWARASWRMYSERAMLIPCVVDQGDFPALGSSSYAAQAQFLTAQSLQPPGPPPGISAPAGGGGGASGGQSNGPRDDQGDDFPALGGLRGGAGPGSVVSDGKDRVRPFDPSYHACCTADLDACSCRRTCAIRKHRPHHPRHYPTAPPRDRIPTRPRHRSSTCSQTRPRRRRKHKHGCAKRSRKRHRQEGWSKSRDLCSRSCRALLISGA